MIGPRSISVSNGKRQVKLTSEQDIDSAQATSLVQAALHTVTVPRVKAPK